MPGQSFPQFLFQALILKNGLHSGGLNTGPLGHESSALTTRPRLLATRVVGIFVLTSFFKAIAIRAVEHLPKELVIQQLFLQLQFCFDTFIGICRRSNN